MKKVLLLAFMSVATFFAFAQEEAPAVEDGGPRIEFTDMTVDYGTIENGSNGEREFAFVNTGDQPLVIKTCRGSCGCTVPKCPTEPTMPGEKGVIKVKYDTNRIGSFTKTVTVETNDPTGTKILKIKGVVEQKPVENSPAPAQ